MESSHPAPEFERHDGGERRRARAQWSLRLLGSAASAFGLACVVIALYPDPSAKIDKAKVASPPKLGWVPVSQPTPLYGLDAPDWVGPPGPYEARSHFPDGGRDDSLSFGRLNGETAYVRLSIYRAQPEDLPATSLFLDLARMAAESGLWVGRSTVTAPLATRFGTVEAADLALAERDQAANCLGFRFLASDLKLRMVGFYCGTAVRPADRVGLACLINRLDLLSGEDPALREFFTRADRRREESPCLPARLAGGGETVDGPGALAPNTQTVRTGSGKVGK
jgi:hypothetical protein